MDSNLKRLLCMLLCAAMLVGMVPPIPVSAAETGTCGAAVNWSFEDASGKLTISGSGPMSDFSGTTIPWKSYADKIQTVVLEEGVTSVGEYAFYGFEKLLNVTFSETVATIGSHAFDGCDGLTCVVLPRAVAAIEDSAFADCKMLNTIIFEGDPPQISESGFDGLVIDAYYRSSRESWTTDMLQDYGGALTWYPDTMIPYVSMYRLYNPNSGEHFYTGSEEERDNLIEAGWEYEGVAWNAPVKGGDPVYRVYNPVASDHHYTMSWEEVENLMDVGWQYEGVCWNSADADGIFPMFRLYNPNAYTGAHHYTGSEEERDDLAELGWNYEGIGWYGVLGYYDTESDLSITITNSDYQETTQSIITSDGTVELTGTVTGAGEVQKLSITYKGYHTDETVVKPTGKSQWTCPIPLETGTNEVTVSAYATDGLVEQTVVYINKTSESVAYKDTVKVADEEDYETIYNEAVACWSDDNGTDLASDDTIVMLVSEDALLLDQIEDELLKPGDLYMIPDNELFAVGFSGVYKTHRAPVGCEDYPAEDYPDSEYEEIVFDYAGFADLFEEDISLNFDGIDTEDPIAFVMTGNGMPVSVEGESSGELNYRVPAMMANTYYGAPGWQTEELLSSIIPSLDVDVDSYGRLSVKLTWADIVVYDDDGKKNPSSGIDADKGQLKLSGEVGITDLKYTGGMEWHPSLVPWDIELLPQQMISKLEYTQGGGLELKGGVSASTSDLIKKINKYKNQKEFWGMEVNGVKTFENKLVLCILGVNLAPVAVKPYKTLKGLAAASTMTTPKLFLYIFLDADGNVSIEGSLNMKYSADVVKGFNVQRNGYTGSYGSQAQNRSDKHYKVGSTHTLDIYDTNDNKGGLNLSLNGKVSASLDIGPGLGAGLMICGVCPATVDGEMFYRASGEAEGELKFLPAPPDLDGYASLYHGIGVQSDVVARAIVKTKIGEAGFDVNKHFEHMFWEENLSTSKFEGKVYTADDDADNSNNAVITGAEVTLKKKDTGDVWTAMSDGSGQYRFGSLPNGEYSMLVEKDGYDSYTNDSIIFEKEKELDVFLNEQNPWDGSCVLSGKIVIADTDTNMTNNQPLAGASITLRNVTNNAVTSTVTAADGTYSFENIPAGNYSITISKDGYITIYAAVSVAENILNYYNATMEAISEDYEGDGVASGTVYDALNGQPVAGLTLHFRGGVGTSSGEIVETVTTNAQGQYETPYMSAGNYTAEIVDERELDDEDARYLTTTFTVKILGGQSIPNQDGFVTNGLMPDQMRIVLKWGSTPSDLDSHMVGPSTDGGRFHTYYGNKNYYSVELMANLDLDDVSSYGPETTTIYESSPGIYTFFVHDFTNGGSSSSTAMANSGAYVEIFLGVSDVVAHRFDVPNAAGTLWTVFSYNSITGEILPINTMSYYYSGTSGIGSSIPVQESEAAAVNAFEEEIIWDTPLKDYELEEQVSEASQQSADISPEPGAVSEASETADAAPEATESEADAAAELPAPDDAEETVA